jgi:site-specific recombinase XerD
VRTPNRTRGRFSSLSGMSTIKDLGCGIYPLIVIDRDGLPVFPITEWYRIRAQGAGTRSTLDTYLGLLLPFTAYLRDNDRAWNDPPDEIRAHLRTFLLRQLDCSLIPDRDLEGYRVGLGGDTPLSASGLRGMLAAWRDFYTVMAEEQLYAYPNPLESRLLTSLRRQRARHVLNAGAPDIAGIRSASRRVEGRQPSAFFRVQQADGWRLDPAFATTEVLEKLSMAFRVMVNAHGLSTRDRVVLLLLRHTGARVHEICGLTAGGYRCHTLRGIPGRALVRNKGSRGREEKTIHFGAVPQIPQLVDRYVREERARHDSNGRTRLTDLGDGEPLFLTKRGTAYSYGTFKGVWRWLYPRARARCALDFSPHDLRHLHVTQLLMKGRAAHGASGKGYEDAKESISRLMGWRSPDTVEVYDHTLRDADALELLVALQRDIVDGVTLADTPPVATPDTLPSEPRDADMAGTGDAPPSIDHDDLAGWIGSYGAGAPPVRRGG